MTNPILSSYVVPVHPHPLLVPEQNEGWQRLRDAFDEARDQIAASGADLMIIYSTTWPSIIGHQIQADPNPVWTLVDQDFHELGSMDYSFNIDAEFAEAEQGQSRPWFAEQNGCIQWISNRCWFGCCTEVTQSRQCHSCCYCFIECLCKSC